MAVEFVRLSRPLIAGAAALCTVFCDSGDAERNRAARILERAMVSLGGVEHVNSIRTWDIEGSGRENLTAEAQGMAPDRPTWRAHEERVVVDALTLTVAWQRHTPRNDHSVRWRRFIYGPDRTGVVDLASRRGVLRPAATAEQRRRRLARRVPHLLLLEAATAARDAVWVGERRLNGETHDLIRVDAVDDAELVLMVSRHPVSLRRVEYRTYLPTRGDVTVGWEWQEWTADTALGLIPAGHRVDVDGTPFQEVRYSRFAGNSDIAPLLTVADTTSAANRSTPAAAPPASALAATGEVSPGVHVTSVNGFVVMAIEFHDFVVALEAPEAHPGLEMIPAERPATAVSAPHLAWVRDVASRKPIRYAVITHHHSDHMGGVRAFAAAGASILVPTGDVAAARHALTAPQSIDPDSLEGEIVDPTVEGVTNHRVIEDAQRRLEIFNVGSNPHTHENLLVWLPHERIVYQGDLFYFSQNGPFPPSGRATMNRFLADWLASRGIEPAAIYGVHNSGVAGPTALARSAAAPGTPSEHVRQR